LNTRHGYPHLAALPTRWLDNDIYGHVNNVVYYALFDTVINQFLIERGGLDLHHGAVVGVCAESHCRYRQGFSFPETVEAGLRVGELRNRSVRYEIGIFKKGVEEAAAEGWFVHVFVERTSLTPTPIPAGIREALERLCVDAASSSSKSTSPSC
jgi:acyl-CoA thioester hydrolase